VACVRIECRCCGSRVDVLRIRTLSGLVEARAGSVYLYGQTTVDGMVQLVPNASLCGERLYCAFRMHILHDFVC
jgi:hypothetical protein